VSAERRDLPAVVEATVPVKAATLRHALAVPAVIASAGNHAARRFLEFFAATIRNKNTRMAYYRAACHFFAWVEQHEIGELADIEPIHVAAYIEVLQTTAAKPTVKLHLAAIRILFDWLVVGQVVAVNPAHAVRGPKHVVRRGKTPVLTEDQARRLLGSVKVARKITLPDGAEAEEPWLVALRDRALMAVMTYSFARIGAVVAMRVEDYYPGGKRWWVRLDEKGGKRPWSSVSSAFRRRQVRTRLAAGGRWIRTSGSAPAATPLTDRGVKPQATAAGCHFGEILP
jgi:site-specific recombinase XerD